MTPQPTAEAGVLFLLRKLSASMFYGALTLKYENGVIVHLRKEENIKPTTLNLPDENRGSLNDQHLDS
jgi:hypothetical protein